MFRSVLIAAAAGSLIIAAPAWAGSKDSDRVEDAARHNQCSRLSNNDLRKACQKLVDHDSHGEGKGHCKDNGRGHEIGHGKGHDKDDDCPVSAG